MQDSNNKMPRGIQGWKGKYDGERVFMVGNGPSIANTPMDFLCGEFTFAMNRISMLYESTKWRPSFFVCTTTNVELDDWRADIMKTIDAGTPTFIWDELSKWFDKGKTNIYALKCTHGEELTDNPEYSWWSDDPSKTVCKYGTSMLVALQLAFYMGFKEVYLLGCDLGFQSEKGIWASKWGKSLRKRGIGPKLLPDANHFNAKYGTPGFKASELNDNMLGAHKLVLRAAERHGVKVCNATIGGELELYPRVNLNQLIKKDA